MARPKEFDPTLVLELAAAVFRTKGYEAASIQDLTEAMGINRGSLYATYGDKEQLFVAVLDWYDANHEPALWATLAAPDAGLPAIRAFLLDHAASLGRCDQPAGCLLVDTALGCAHIPSLAAAIRVRVGALEALIYQVLRRAQGAGELTPTADPLALARFLTATLHGMAVISKVQRDPIALRDIAMSALGALPAGTGT